jgi:hypothetical protein
VERRIGAHRIRITDTNMERIGCFLMRSDREAVQVRPRSCPGETNVIKVEDHMIANNPGNILRDMAISLLWKQSWRSQING